MVLLAFLICRSHAHTYNMQYIMCSKCCLSYVAICQSRVGKLGALTQAKCYMIPRAGV